MPEQDRSDMTDFYLDPTFYTIQDSLYSVNHFN